MNQNDIIEPEELKFCATCGFEGNDMMCPICNEKMQSLQTEVEKLAITENDKSDIFDDISLESEQQKEAKDEKHDEEDTAL